MSDPYKILGVTSSATDDEVKKAYRTLSRKYHPDTNVNNPNKEKAEELFKLVQQAYEQIMRERSERSSYGGSGRYDYGSFGDFASSFGGYGHSGSGYSSSYGSQSSSAGEDDEDSLHMRAAANFIRSRQFAQALNLLSSISNKTALWYYYSAIANSGAGNNLTALNHARTASEMEPYNAEYRELVSRLSSGGDWYNRQSTFYGYPVTGSVDCGRLCCTLMVCNACMGGGVPILCC
ncbi:J domain-containing protein [Butyrivibrio sp. MC2013]|uniref:J domain-containing protein n=1 Tax=Butyrivibrio sp. MC2013 TaxID=1280686 RepID=UPI0004184271|nr:J domain-containing protein [Butyrivibrio sp. MC2013]